MAGAVGASACDTSTPSGAADVAGDKEASISALSSTDATEAAAEMDAPESVACAVPQDCIDFSSIGINQPLAACCINNACIYGQAAFDAVHCTDADVQLILASNYDQSCQTDSDCIGVGEGNFCIPGARNCPSSAAINRSAYSQYQADVAKTNASICSAVSSCGGGFGPCCRHGFCQMGPVCSDSSSRPEDEAGADSGDGSAE
jgi:hypothetical protein